MAFWIMLIWVLIIWYFYQDSMSTRTLYGDGTFDIKVTWKFMILIFSVPIIIIGLRTEFIDTGSYISEYEKIIPEMNLFDDFANKRDHSKLFYGFEFLFKAFVSKESQVWIFVVALIQAVLLLRTIKKYSVDPGLSVVLFITSCLVCHWMCNGIRQFLAVSILFACTDWLLKKRWYLYLPLTVLLMGLSPITSRLGIGSELPWYLDGIHQSVLIMLPIFFCISGKVFNKKIWLVIICLLGLIMTGSLDDILNSSVEGTTYVADMENVEADEGTSIIRVLVETIPFAMSFLCRKELMKEDTPKVISLSVNASAITASLYWASAFTSGIYVGRLPVYTELYSIILLPWLLAHPYKENQKNITTIMILAYLFYFYYQISVQWKGYYQSTYLGFGV